MYKLFPIPKSCEFHQGMFPLAAIPYIAVDEAIQDSCNSHGYDPEAAISNLFTGTQPSVSASVRVDHSASHPEAFSLEITGSDIHITCNTGAGLFYAVKVLNQLATQTNGLLPCMSLKDEPALDIRGIMLDIGRDKIPSMETLFSLLDLFSDMRINHVQLYMEGFCFQYEAFQYLFAGETPLAPDEFQELSVYAKKRFIDLVPNQNVLGHMEKWLEKPQFNPLAECEDGYLFENIYWRPPMTLDVRDPGSFHLAETLLDPLLQQSQSEYINVNMDEPFELGAGKNKEAAKKEGRMGLYFEYLEKLHAYCQKKGKKMMVWGDEILHHPECVPHFPSDITLLDWIYEGEADFTSHAQLMKETGLSFCLCPGTSSWGSLTGRFDNMKK
ncbi:MAG: family 20 glycosylhydrolase, partial [Hungatella sp.]